MENITRRVARHALFPLCSDPETDQTDKSSFSSIFHRRQPKLHPRSARQQLRLLLLLYVITGKYVAPRKKTPESHLTSVPLAGYGENPNSKYSRHQRILLKNNYYLKVVRMETAIFLKRLQLRQVSIVIRDVDRNSILLILSQMPSDRLWIFYFLFVWPVVFLTA